MYKKIIAISLLFLFIFISPIKIEATSDAVMITANPGEDASSQIGISWHMDVDKTKGKVIYTKKTDTNWEDSQEVFGEKEVITVFHGRTFLHYTALLVNLDSDTEYMYKVGQDNLSEEYYFKTAGKDSFNFLWVSDWHAYAPLPTRTNNVTKVIDYSLIHEPDIDFIFSTGDDNAYGSDYEAYLYVHSKPQYKNFLWASTVGNHDIMNNVVVDGKKLPDTDDFFVKTHNLPKNGYAGQEGASYFFKYGSVLFIVLNSEDIKKKTPLAKVKEWVKEVIDNNPSQYIAVAMHYQWFDGRRGSISAQYNDWKDFFDENNVDLAMAGNNHVYLKTKGRIYDGKPTNTEKGTVYMQVPSSDGERGVVIGDLTQNTDIIDMTWSQGTNTIGAIIVNVTKEGIETRLIDGHGRIRDENSFNSRYKDYDFDKESFLESIQFYQDPDNADNVIINADEEGLKFIDRIEYYEEEKLLDTNYFYQIKDTSFLLKGVNNFNKLKAKVIFLDGTSSEELLFNNEYYQLENLKVERKENKLELSWDYFGNDEFNIYVYDENQFLKEVNVNEKSIEFSNINLNTTFTIKPEKNSSINYYNVKYNIFGDANLDNEVDLEDAELLMDYLLGKIDLDEEVIDYLDIDSDGEITLIDLTYIHLYTNNVSQIKTKKKFNVTFYDEKGTIIEKFEVYRGNSILPPDISTFGEYRLLGWDKDLNNISKDLEVRPILTLVGEKQ